MAIQLRIPTTKTFLLKADEGPVFPTLRRCADSESPDCTLVFRQATAIDVEQRSAAMSRRTLRNDGNDLVVVNDTNLDFVARLEVFLTLSAADIEMPDGTSLEFDARHRIKSRKQFDEWWDLMPSPWAREIHACCLEANPDWGTLKSS